MSYALHRQTGKHTKHRSKHDPCQPVAKVIRYTRFYGPGVFPVTQLRLSNSKHWLKLGNTPISLIRSSHGHTQRIWKEGDSPPTTPFFPIPSCPPSFSPFPSPQSLPWQNPLLRKSAHVGRHFSRRDGHLVVCVFKRNFTNNAFVRSVISCDDFCCF